MFEFLFGFGGFFFGNPNDLCKELLGEGEGEAASGLKLTVSHNIFSKE